MNASFSYRLFREEGDLLLAISDSAIVGKTFEEGDLSITVSENFYSGKSCNSTDAAKLIRMATIVNAVGKDIVALLLKQKLIDKKMILTVSGVPHAQIIKLGPG